jgi:hypothetical protein
MVQTIGSKLLASRTGVLDLMLLGVEVGTPGSFPTRCPPPARDAGHEDGRESNPAEEPAP